LPEDEHDHPSRKAPTVRVRGQAAIRTEPDEAIVWITLTKLDPSVSAALTDVAERSQALADLLDELAIDRRQRSTGGVTVREEFDRTKSGRRSLGHRAASMMSVRLTDTELIGRLITRATTAVDARIEGPSWQISRANPARLQAATQAAANARQKAEAYAAGVEARLGRVIALSEEEGGYGSGRFPMAVAASAPPPDLDVEAGEQDVTAAIEATFELEPEGGATAGRRAARG
jgi:uncharacterized protein YggE